MPNVDSPPSSEVAERAQQVRDLRSKISELDKEDEREIVFKAPHRLRMTTIYSMVDGEPLPVPANSVHQTLRKRLPGGGYMFTAKQEEAPAYERGEVKCFLHPESIERASGLLAAAGIAAKTCDSAHLASAYAMQEVAKSKHKKEWAAYQEYLREQREVDDRAERRTQTEAMLAMAGRSVGLKACKSCHQPIEGKLADHSCPPRNP